MSSINLGPFGEHFFNFFEKPQTPFSLPTLLSLTLTQKPLFSSLSTSFSASKKPEPNPPTPDNPPNPDNPVGRHQQLLDQYWWECDNLPDYRHTPEVEKLLNRDPLSDFFDTDDNTPPEEILANKKALEDFNKSPFGKFMARAEEIQDMINEMELKANENPYRKEDRKLWKSVPHVKGLDGRPMVRKAIKSKEESDDKFWDFARQFFFGLWGFQQRPYPVGKPIDAAQAIGYKRLEKRYYDCECCVFLFSSIQFGLV